MEDRVNYHTCPICLDSMHVCDNSLCLIPCDHKFHAECIRKWWERSKSRTCPYCNQSWDIDHDNLTKDTDRYLIKASQSGIRIPVDQDKLREWIESWANGELPINRQLPRHDANFMYRHLVGYLRTKPNVNEICQLLSRRLQSLVERCYIIDKSGVYTWH